MSFSSSRGCSTGTSRRAVSPLGLASIDCVSRVPAPAASSAYELTTSIPLVEKRVWAPVGGSYAVTSMLDVDGPAAHLEHLPHARAGPERAASRS